jgi:hypothetical protein
MRSSLRTPIPVLVLLIALAAAAPAGAIDVNGFLPAAGEGDVALSYTAESWDSFWLGETKVDSPPELGTVDLTSITLWGRFGLTDNAALIVNLPHVDADNDGLVNFDDSGLQDAAALLLARFASYGSGAVQHRWLGGLGLRTPASGYEANLPVDIGDGTTDILTRLVYQLEWGGGYFSQQVGFDLRSKDAPDNWTLYTELGFPTGPVTWIGYYQQVLANGGTDIGDSGFTFPSNQEEFQRVGLRVFGRFNDHFGLSGSYFTTLDGRNSAETEGFSVGTVFGF